MPEKNEFTAEGRNKDGKFTLKLRNVSSSEARQWRILSTDLLNQKFDPSHGKNLKDHVLDEEEIVLQIKKVQAESDIWLFIIDPTNKHDVPELRVEGGTIVGSCQLYWEGDTDGCHISCIIHHRFLRNGYARAALGAAIDYAFYTPHMKQETVILETMKTNAPFRGLMESLQLKDRETPGSYWAQADSPIESVMYTFGEVRWEQAKRDAANMK